MSSQEAGARGKQTNNVSYPHELGPVPDPGRDVIQDSGVSLALVIQKHVEAVLSEEAHSVDEAAEYRVVGKVVVAGASRAGVGW